jgi:hypothetical protein
MRAPLAIVAVMLLSGCPASSPVTKTEIVEKPIVIRCTVEAPPECRSDYAMDSLQAGSNPVQVNRAVLAEIEQRRACEVKLIAALKGCNDVTGR